MFECKTHDSRSEEEQFPIMAQEEEEHPVLTKSRLEDIAKRVEGDSSVDIVEYEVSQGSKKGKDNFVGELLACTVKTSSGQEHRKGKIFCYWWSSQISSFCFVTISANKKIAELFF